MFDCVVSKTVASRVLSKMGWSWKVPVQFQLQKYTIDNLQHYLHYISAVQQMDFHKLHFLDEAHFVSKNLTNGKVVGLVNQRVWVKQNTLHSKNGTLTILTSLVGDPVVCSYTTDNNSQHAFLDFVVDCCLNGDLNSGDYLVLDNAPVHSNHG